MILSGQALNKQFLTFFKNNSELLNLFYVSQDFNIWKPLLFICLNTRLLNKHDLMRSQGGKKRADGVKPDVSLMSKNLFVNMSKSIFFQLFPCQHDLQNGLIKYKHMEHCALCPLLWYLSSCFTINDFANEASVQNSPASPSGKRVTAPPCFTLTCPENKPWSTDWYHVSLCRDLKNKLFVSKNKPLLRACIESEECVKTSPEAQWLEKIP